MKIGVITDIHNNLPALEAILAQMDDCSSIVCCGDIIGIGPHPEETVQRMRRIPNLIAVQGNHDRYFTQGMPSAVPNAENMGEDEMGMHRWEHARLSQESKEFLQALPLRADWHAEDLRITAMHYCMDDHQRYAGFAPDPSGEDLQRMFRSTDADVILYGHDHAPCVRCAGGRLFVNAGSLGCPSRAKNVARAGILTLNNGHAEFAPLHVKYDAAAVVSDIDRLSYPAHADIKRIFFGIE